MSLQSISVVVFAVGLLGGCAGSDEPSLLGEWQIVKKDGVDNPHPSSLTFTFTQDVLVIGEEVAEGGYLHSAALPYTFDTASAPARLDYEGTSTVASQIGIAELVDDATLIWKVTDADRSRPIDFAPDPAGATLYELLRTY